MSDRERDRHSRRCHGTVALDSSHPRIRQLKREGHRPSIHGTKVWRSSFVAMNYLHENPIPERARVIDVGCGWGLTGIFLAKTFNADVTGIDADASVKPYLDAQASENDVSVDFQHRKFEDIRRRDLQGVHTLVGSDICFWDEMTKPLYKLVRRAARAGVQQVVIADPGRTPFWKLASKCQKKFNAEVVEKQIKKPCRTRKQILIVRP